jgi:hypothetical protein
MDTFLPFREAFHSDQILETKGVSTETHQDDNFHWTDPGIFATGTPRSSNGF